MSLPLRRHHHHRSSAVLSSPIVGPEKEVAGSRTRTPCTCGRVRRKHVALRGVEFDDRRASPGWVCLPLCLAGYEMPQAGRTSCSAAFDLLGRGVSGMGLSVLVVVVALVIAFVVSHFQKPANSAGASSAYLTVCWMLAWPSHAWIACVSCPAPASAYPQPCPACVWTEQQACTELRDHALRVSIQRPPAWASS